MIHIAEILPPRTCLAILTLWVGSQICCVAAENELVIVEQQEIIGRATLRGRSAAAKQELLSNPVPWRTIKDVVPDGAAVEAGQEIAVFDDLSLKQELEEQLLSKRIDDLSVERDVANIDNQLTDLREKLDDLEGQLKVAKARLATLEALPSQVDVIIDSGRLKLAQMQYKAAAADHERAQDRYQRGLIGAGEVARLEAEAEIAAANLVYAETKLAISKRPADPLELERSRLQIANLELDVGAQRATYEKRQAIAELRRANARRRNQRIDRKIKETQEDLDKLVVTAPTDGFVLYTDRFKRALSENGGKLWRNHQFMRIPQADSLIFKCTIPEYQRSWFSKGDPATVSVPGMANLRLQGRIDTIGDMPRDREDDKQEAWAEYDTRSGVKVYDVTVKCDERPASISPGFNVVIELRGSKAITARTVPLTFVRYRDGVPQLAIDGHETAVEGQAVGPHFVIESDIPAVGARVLRHGTQLTKASRKQAAEADGAHFRVSGELIPTDTVDVRVGRIHWHGSKVTWLLDEGTAVKKGDLLAKLDDDEIKKEIEKQENDAEANRNTVETEAEELDLLRKDSELRQAKMANDLRRAEIEHQLATEQRNDAAIAAAKRDATTSAIRLSEAERLLTNLQARDPDLVSGSEITRQQRSVLRARLGDERSRLKLAQVLAGPDDLARSKADLALLRTHNEHAIAKQKMDYDLAKSERSWQRARVRLQRSERWLSELKQWRDNLEVRSPADGLLQYSLTRADEGLAKIQKGSSVRSSMRILKIADTSRMAVRVALPEAYFTAVQEGMPISATGEDLPVLSGSVERIEFVFEPKRRNDSDIGLYSEREPSGETVFYTRIALDEVEGAVLKPGMMVEVTFPFASAGDRGQPKSPSNSTPPYAEQAVAEHRP